MRRLLKRLVNTLRDGRAEAELAREMAAHLALLEDEYRRRGMSADQARNAARRAMGGVEQAKERHRDARAFRWVYDLRQDMRYAVRLLVKYRGFTTVAVLSLALGIGATSTIFSVLHAAVLRPLPFPEPERLVEIREVDPVSGRQRNPTTAALLAWREQAQTFKRLSNGLFGGGIPQVLSGGETRARGRARIVGAEIFDLMGVEPVLGRTFAADDFPGNTAVVISHSLWQQLFGGDPAALGQELTYGTGEKHTIIGVMPTGFWLDPETVLTDHVWQAQIPVGGRGRNFGVVGRLNPGVSVEQAQAELERISRGLAPAGTIEGQSWQVRVDPMEQRLTARYAGTLYVLFGAVGCVLLIACLNVATLSLGRASARQTELASRLALGARRGRLVRQLLSESVLLALVGGVLGVGLAFAGTRMVTTLPAGWYPPTAEILIDGTVLAFSMALSVLAGIVSGVAPAVRSSAVHLSDALKAGGRGTGGSGSRSGDALVVLQAALALVLLIGAGLMLNSYMRLERVDPGFRPEHLLTVGFDLRLDQYMSGQPPIIRVRPRTALVQQQLLDRIEALPDVSTVGLASTSPQRSVPVVRVGGPVAAQDDRFQATYLEISPEYFRTLRAPLLKGREFTTRDRAEAPGVAIINETMARQFFPGEDPIGADIQADMIGGTVHENLIGDTPRTIVGVAGDVKPSLRGEVEPLLYVPYGQHMDVYPSFGYWNVPTYKRLVIRTTADPLQLVEAVRGVMADVDPDLVPYDIMTMDARLAYSIRRERSWLLLLGLFAGIAVTLAVVGLYGVIAYAVARRTHELGVRTALGATRADVLGLVVRQGLALALLGVGIGIPAAVALTRVLASRLFGVTPTDPATFTAAAVLFVSVAFLACAIPARRATRVDPLVALRFE